MTDRRFVLAAAATAALVFPTAAAADAGEARRTASEIQHALAAQPSAPPAIERAGPRAPALGSQDLPLRGGGALGLPAFGAGTTVGATTIYAAAGTAAAQIAVQQVGIGTRALINIDDRSAPERYEFRLGADVSRMQLHRDGSVAVYNADRDLIGGFAKPWAVDAAGRPVATHFEVAGATLAQVVKHRVRPFDYGVTADPFWLGLAIRACKALRCYRWMPSFVENQFRHGHLTPAVVHFLRTWFCARTWIC